MLNRLPFYLRMTIPLCRLFSNPIAGLHYCMVRTGLLRIPLCISDAPGGIYKNLRNIWFSRILRRWLSLLVRTPLRNKILGLVDFTFPLEDTGCVIVVCHTPWARLLVQWCLTNEFALIITSNKWNQRTSSIKRTGRGFRELRHLTRHLRSGGRVIIMADVFNDLGNCPVKFFEQDCNVSLLPVRLAKITKVPLIAAVPELQNGAIHIHTGPRSDFKISDHEPRAVTQYFLSFFEKEIKRNPSVWSVFVCQPLSRYMDKTSLSVKLVETDGNKQMQVS